MLGDLGTEKVTDEHGHEFTVPSFNPIFMMATPARAAARSKFANWPACAA